MNKRAGEFHNEQSSNWCSKKPKLNENANLMYGIPEFNLGDDWNLHRACLESCFSLKCIADQVKKVSIFIVSLGKDAYQTMRDLCKPELPNQKTFEQLCEIMEEHYLKSLVLKKRREFHRMQQLNSETISQWFDRVKKVAAQCDFGGQLDERIKDQFVNGMEDGEILNCVLGASYKMILQNIIEIALKKEEELRPIEKLPEEILIHIFSYLPIVDRIRVERVKKSWQEMAKKSWNNFKKLDIKSLYL